MADSAQSQPEVGAKPPPGAAILPPPRFSRLAEELIADFRHIPDETPARMRKRTTRDMAVLVEELLVKHQVGRPSLEQTIRDRWPEIVGAANAAYSHAAQIDTRGQLVILASHGVVRSELILHRETIIARIRQVPGCGQIKGIHVRAG